MGLLAGSSHHLEAALAARRRCLGWAQQVAELLLQQAQQHAHNQQLLLVLLPCASAWVRLGALHEVHPATASSLVGTALQLLQAQADQVGWLPLQPAAAAIKRPLHMGDWWRWTHWLAAQMPVCSVPIILYSSMQPSTHQLLHHILDPVCPALQVVEAAAAVLLEVAESAPQELLAQLIPASCCSLAAAACQAAAAQALHRAACWCRAAVGLMAAQPQLLWGPSAMGTELRAALMQVGAHAAPWGSLAISASTQQTPSAAEGSGANMYLLLCATPAPTGRTKPYLLPLKGLH
jgi:hypothetical protein